MSRASIQIASTPRCKCLLFVAGGDTRSTTRLSSGPKLMEITPPIWFARRSSCRNLFRSNSTGLEDQRQIRDIPSANFGKISGATWKDANQFDLRFIRVLSMMSDTKQHVRLCQHTSDKKRTMVDEAREQCTNIAYAASICVAVAADTWGKPDHNAGARGVRATISSAGCPAVQIRRGDS